jgi:ABC-type multidrug transport system fused ATPase/permease subunit
VIVVLDGSGVTGVGTHDELVRLGGRYTSLDETRAASCR